MKLRNLCMQRLKLLLIACFLLFLGSPAAAQSIIFFPVILKGHGMLKNTIGIIAPYGNQNYILNPSGEIAGNFAQLGTATVTRVTTYQKYGLYSYQVATVADNDGVSLTLLALPAQLAHISMRVRGQLPPAWDWSLDNVNYHAPKFIERIDPYWTLYGVEIPPGQASASTTLYVRQNGAGAGTFWLDGLQVEPSELTTYIDGTQEGCAWLGAAHASASYRSADSRAGGTVNDFYETYKFFPEKIIGGGAAVEGLNIDSYALLPGGELNSSKIQPRDFTIIGRFFGDTEEELHENIQALELELDLNTYPAQQPVRLRFSGAKVQKEIAARYTGGLEGDLPIYYNEDLEATDNRWGKVFRFTAVAPIQFIATDPFWYEVGESATLLDTLDTATFRIVAGRLKDTGQWSALGPPNASGTYNDIQSIAEDATYIYFGGDFLNFDNIANADYIVRYNKQTGAYSAMGTGMNGAVLALAAGANGVLYAGGQFTSAGGVANTSRIAAWDGSAWSALSTGINGDVNAIAIGLDGTVYAGGNFSTAGGGAANYLAAWNGSAWAAFASEVNGVVGDMAIAPDGTLYVVGAFTLAGATTVNYIAAWNGSAWAALGDGLGNTSGAIAVSSDGIVYIGGTFTTAGGNSANYVVSWNGTAYIPMGSGMDAAVTVIKVGADGTVWAGGSFSTAGGLTLGDRIARWNGYTWSHTDIDLPGTAAVFGLLPSKYTDPVVKQQYDLWIGFNTSGTGSFAGLVTATNEGTTPAFPRIIFSRSGGTGATIQSVRNERTGRQLLFDYGLLDGETLTVDLDPRNRTIISSFFGEQMGAVLANSDLSIWQLLHGNQPVTAFVSAAGSPTVVGYLLWRDAYKSLN